MNAASPESAAGLARRAFDVLEPVYARLERIADAVVASRPAGGAGWSEAHLGSLQDLLVALLVEDELAAGLGFVAAPGVIDGLDRFMAWWQRQGERTARLRLNFDPSSIDVYDYLQMDWFRLAEQGRRRVTYGPYVDYSGSELYIVTATMPIVAEGEFVGVAGADLVVGELERRLIGVLRGSPLDAVIVNPDRRVIAANSPRWVFGARLAAVPTVGAEGPRDAFVDVADLPGGTGWVLALATPEGEERIPAGT